MNAIYYSPSAKKWIAQPDNANINFSNKTLENIGYLGINTLDIDSYISGLTGTSVSWMAWTTATDQHDIEKNLEALAYKVYLLDNTSMYIKGDISCSGNPNYPAAGKGDVYRCSSAGRIGGASGKYVDVDDLIICDLDSVSGTEAAVGANWVVIQGNQAASFWPQSNVDVIDIYGSNLTTASILDADLSSHVSGQIIDITLDTSDIAADTDILRITDSRNHDDAAADAYCGVTIENSGNFPGTAASTTYLVNGEYSGTIGASGALATLYAIRGDISGATITAGTAAAGYFSDGTQSIMIANGTNALYSIGNFRIDGTGVDSSHLFDLENIALTTGSIWDIGAITTKTSGYLYNGSLTTSTIDATLILDDFSVSCDHDDAAGDTLRMIRRTWSGDVPGSTASDLAIIEGTITGTIGASGASAVAYAIKGDISGGTLTAGTFAAGYFADTNIRTLICDDTDALSFLSSAAVNSILSITDSGSDEIEYLVDLSGTTGGNGYITSDSGTAATTWKARIKVKTDDGTDGWINVYSTSNEA